MGSKTAENSQKKDPVKATESAKIEKASCKVNVCDAEVYKLAFMFYLIIIYYLIKAFSRNDYNRVL